MIVKKCENSEKGKTARNQATVFSSALRRNALTGGRWPTAATRQGVD